MKQKQWRRLITEEYKKKYYSNGYFGYLEAENNSAGSRAGYWIAFILVGILMNLGFWFAPFAYIGGEGKVNLPFLISMAVGIVWFLLASLLLRMGKKRKNRTREDWIAQAAEASGMTESEVREFDRQVVESESWFFTPCGKLDPVLEYILTEDYFFMGTRVMQKILPYRNFAGGCFTYDENRKFSVALITRESYFCIETEREIGTEFLTMLSEKNPNMQIKPEGTLKLREVEKWFREFKNGNM